MESAPPAHTSSANRPASSNRARSPPPAPPATKRTLAHTWRSRAWVAWAWRSQCGVLFEDIGARDGSGTP